MALSAALVLIAVPTFWALFPWLGGIWRVWRVMVFAAWLVAAALIVLSTDRQARQVDELMGEVERHRRRERKKAGDVAIGLLLQGSALCGHELNLDLYLPTGHGKVRVEYSSKIPLAPVEWSHSRGATGIAFSSGERVYASGPAAKDETYLLTAKEQADATDLEVVASEPVKNAAGRTIAVVTAYSETNDGWINTGYGKAEHKALAEAIARLLIDVCGLATDDVTPL